MTISAEELAQRRLHTLADQIDPSLRQAFLALIKKLAPESIAELTRLLEIGDLYGAAQYLADGPRATTAWTTMRTVYAESIVRLTKAIARDLASAGPRLRLVVVAPVASPALVAAVRQWEDQSFSRIKRDITEGLRELVASELQRGLGPRQVALRLKAGITNGGLTAYDRRIIESFRRSLQEGRIGDATRRLLRDKRLRLSKAMSPEQIDKAVAAYERRLVALRAETFARTNAMAAANAAAEVSWREAIAQNQITANQVRRYWIVAKDERLCPQCAPMPESNSDGVGLDELFVVPTAAAEDQGIGIQYPPLHPNCRCTVWIRLVRAGVTPSPAPGTMRFAM